MNPVLNLDQEQIRLSLQALLTNREIFIARVLGKNGEVMSAASAVPQKASPDALLSLSRDIVFDAGSGNRLIGALELAATRYLVWDQTRDRLLIAGVIALGAVSIEVPAALCAMRSIVGDHGGGCSLGSTMRARVWNASR